MLGTIILVLIIVLLLLGAVLFFAPNQPVKKKPTEEINDWEYQKEQTKREHQAEKNKEWFEVGRWLTDKEIDWATSRMEKEQAMPGSWPGQSANRFKVLPAHQFCYCAEVMRKKESGADLAFQELLNQINDSSRELIFIPVNNPNFHWSLLVYEVKNKCFYHYDTLKGANHGYVKPLVKELLSQIWQTNPDLEQLLVKRHDIRQGNGWECGVACVGIMRRIKEKYDRQMENIELGKFDFAGEQEKLRKEYLQENKT